MVRQTRSGVAGMSTCFTPNLAEGVDNLSAEKLTVGRTHATFLILIDWVGERLSKSRDDRGVVVQRLSLINQDSEEVMSHIDTILVQLRHGAN